MLESRFVSWEHLLGPFPPPVPYFSRFCFVVACRGGCLKTLSLTSRVASEGDFSFCCCSSFAATVRHRLCIVNAQGSSKSRQFHCANGQNSERKLEMYKDLRKQHKKNRTAPFFHQSSVPRLALICVAIQRGFVGKEPAEVAYSTLDVVSRGRNGTTLQLPHGVSCRDFFACARRK